MDRLDAMSVLLAVVAEGSLSAGARRLRAPLATVSRKVSELEKHLRTQLLVRSTRRIELTDAGRAYVAAARRIIEQVEDAERDAAGEYRAPRGELHVTAPVLLGRLHVLPVALEFLAAHAEIDLRLLLVDRQVNLVEERIDVAVRVGHLGDSSLMATRVGQVRRVLCASPAYVARRGVPLTPADLCNHDGISFTGFAAAPEWRYRGDGPSFTVEPRKRLTVNTTEAAIDAAVAGLGVLPAVSYQVLAELRAGTLELLLEDFASAPMPVSLIHLNQGLLPQKVRAFLHWSAPRLRSRLGSGSAALLRSDRVVDGHGSGD